MSIRFRSSGLHAALVNGGVCGSTKRGSVRLPDSQLEGFKSDVNALLKPTLMFGMIGASLVLGGYIESRLQRFHPREHERLGSVVSFAPLFSRETFGHPARWLRFIWYEHYRHHDRLLSVSCLLVGLLQLAFFSVLFSGA